MQKDRTRHCFISMAMVPLTNEHCFSRVTAEKEEEEKMMYACLFETTNENSVHSYLFNQVCMSKENQRIMSDLSDRERKKKNKTHLCVVIKQEQEKEQN